MRFKDGELVQFSKVLLDLMVDKYNLHWTHHVKHLIGEPLHVIYVDSDHCSIEEDRYRFGYTENWLEPWVEVFELSEEDFLI